MWIRTFDTVEELRRALLDFPGTDNATWLIERHGFRPPDATAENSLNRRPWPPRVQHGVPSSAGGTQGSRGTETMQDAPRTGRPPVKKGYKALLAEAEADSPFEKSCRG